jgi:hypothetical protein
MKKDRILAGIISILLLFTLVLVGCSDGSDDETETETIATYADTENGLTLTISSGGWWSLALPEGEPLSGTYSIDEEDGTVYLAMNDGDIGIATVDDETEALTVTITDGDYAGEYTLTKQ